MERIKIDKDKLDERFDCPYKYEFRSAWGLDHKSEYPTENFNGFGIDVRDEIFKINIKNFVIQLRKQIYGDSVQEMIQTDLTDLINTKRRYLK